MYYLFYNISSKIFAFLLLPTDCFALYEGAVSVVGGVREEIFIFICTLQSGRRIVNVARFSARGERPLRSLSLFVFFPDGAPRECDPFEMLERELLGTSLVWINLLSHQRPSGLSQMRPVFS